MVSTISITIEGIPDTQKMLDNKQKDIIKNADEAIVKVGFYVQGEVQESIAGQRAEPRSVDTGRFLNSVKTTHEQQLIASVETNVEYAKHLEYGTSRIEPRHHFTNSAKRNEVKVKEFVERAIK